MREGTTSAVRRFRVPATCTLRRRRQVSPASRLKAAPPTRPALKLLAIKLMEDLTFFFRWWPTDQPTNELIPAIVECVTVRRHKMFG